MPGLMRNNGSANVPAEKHRTAAFLNWKIALKGGKELKSSRGLALQGNPLYPNKAESMLIDLAAARGGEVTLTMEVTIRSNTGQDLGEIGLDDFDLPEMEVEGTEGSTEGIEAAGTGSTAGTEADPLAGVPSEQEVPTDVPI